MESKQSHSFRVCGPMITQNLDPMDVLDDLLSENWVSETEYRHIHWLCTRGLTRDAAVQLMEHLRGRLGSFDCFVNALDEKGSFLATELKRHYHQATDGRRREHSLSDLRETLIDGAVPDIPMQHVSRRKLVEGLTNALRSLSNRFKFREKDESSLEFGKLSIQPTAQSNGKLPSFSADALSEQPEYNPPPTNAWLLVHGMAGCGKTVLCTYALRRNPGLLAECFPGGVIWLQVGPLNSAATTPTSPPSSPTRSSLNSQLIALVDRLERKISPSSHFPFGEQWSESHPPVPLLSQSPPSQPAPTSPSFSLPESLDRLRRALIRRQQRTTWGPNEEDFSATSLLLIVLDDVWNVEVGRVLSSLPAAFLVTSRDQNVLQHVETPVDRFPIQSGFSEDEVAQLLASWTNRSANYFLPDPAKNKSNTTAEPTLNSVAQLCHGVPFAATLLGHLLRERYHRLSDYLCDPTNSGSLMLDWSLISRPSAYGYETMCASIQKSFSQLPPAFEGFYQQLVIFEPNVMLTSKVASIYWGMKEDFAEQILGEFTRFSLAIRVWVQSQCCYGYIIHPIQLDLLRLSIDPVKQSSLHSRFVEQYEQYCGGRWTRLVASGEHDYFWYQVTAHLYKSGRLQKLIDLLTDLEFLRSRLSVLGTSLVLAEFNRYRAVFAHLEQMDQWFAYLRFIQTNAYYIVDAASVQPMKRGRSPYRTDSRAASSYTLDSVSPALRADGPGERSISPRRPAVPKGPKGLDLIQLGLGLPYTSPVFQQAVECLLKSHVIAKRVEADDGLNLKRSNSPAPSSASQMTEYYWFWCNSHVAASQLIWAIPTGPQPVTCLALEAPTQSMDEEEGIDTGKRPVRNRERFLAGTKDGRMLLLDASCGYEVAVQQAYPPNVQIKFVEFFNKTECLTCGSNGSLVVSTLPPPEPIDRIHLPGCTRQHDEDDDCVIANGHTTDGLEVSVDDLMAGVDVDEDLDAGPYLEHGDATSAAHGSSGRRATIRASPDLKHATLRPSAHAEIKPPTVLADIPRLTEVIRVDGVIQSTASADESPSSATSSDVLRCIAAPRDLSFLVLNCKSSTENLPDDQLPAVYFIKRSNAKLYLDCSRQLRLPVIPDQKAEEAGEEEEKAENGDKGKRPAVAVLSSVSEDALQVAVVLEDGLIWIYSLEDIGWLACYSTQLALSWAEEVTVSRDRRRSSDLIIRVWKRISSCVDRAPSVSACLFMPQSEDEHSEELEKQTRFAAAVSNYVLLWSVPGAIPSDETALTGLASLMALSKPIMSLSSTTTADILCLDACILANQCVIAGGTTNGRVLFWRVRDGCRLFELTAHATWITAIRLLPMTSAFPSEDIYSHSLSLRNVPLGVLTASANGVIKRWDVGTACLPSPTTPIGVPPSWPTTPVPVQRLPSVDLEPSSMPTALHGLWTDVFSVWFGSHGSLLVVGRRRHCSDLQFLFRPQRNSDPDTVVGENPFTFQEITLRPSQSFYWRAPRKSTVHQSVSNLLGVAPDNSSNAARKASRSNLALDKHWVTTAGLPGTFNGRATTVSFWPCGRWVAVGLSTGIVQVLSLHFDETQLFGIVKRYTLVNNKLVNVTAATRADSSPHKPVDRVVYLHTWQSSCGGDPSAMCTLIVLAVFATGSVAFWHIPNVSSDPSTFDTICVDVTPETFWPPMHSTEFTDYRPGRKLTEHEVQSRVLSDTDVSGIIVPVTWSALRQIPHRSLPEDDSSIESTHRTVLAWLTAGYDGKVYGRQVVFPPSAKPTSEVELRPNREFSPWRFDLEAHTPYVITDADVDSTGEWLITASTDRTAKIWSLLTSSLVFETGKHPDCVRTVCFRPVIDQTDEENEPEWFFGTGDDAGTLRIWALTSAILHHEAIDVGKKTRLSRALSPDSFARPSTTRRVNFFPITDRTPFNGLGTYRSSQRRPSPETLVGGDVSSARTVSLPPRFHSSAAGYGGTWLRRLVWSSDGRLLAGLSDRLCVWPFEPSDSSAPAPGGSPVHVPGLRVGGIRKSVGLVQSMRRPMLQRCRVLRVLSSGVIEASNSSVNLLKVGTRREVNPQDMKSDSLLSSLPPTLVTVDVNTGTLYIFDPIGALFRSELLAE